MNGFIFFISNLLCGIVVTKGVLYGFSRNMTLLPGTLIITGTPAGVGLAREPQVFLKPNDKIVVEIEGVGKLENTVIVEE